MPGVAAPYDGRRNGFEILLRSFTASSCEESRVKKLSGLLFARGKIRPSKQEAAGVGPPGSILPPTAQQLLAGGVLVRQLPLAAWALCPTWSPKVPQAAQHIIYVAVRAPTYCETGASRARLWVLALGVASGGAGGRGGGGGGGGGVAPGAPPLAAWGVKYLKSH